MHISNMDNLMQSPDLGNYNCLELCMHFEEKWKNMNGGVRTRTKKNIQKRVIEARAHSVVY